MSKHTTKTVPINEPITILGHTFQGLKGIRDAVEATSSVGHGKMKGNRFVGWDKPYIFTQAPRLGFNAFMYSKYISVILASIQATTLMRTAISPTISFLNDRSQEMSSSNLRYSRIKGIASLILTNFLNPSLTSTM